MADHKSHPWYRAIRQSMESIVQCVDYNDVKYKMVSNELMELEDIEEYNSLSNRDAVSKMITQVMRSIPDCEKFVEVLQEMPRRRYKRLAEKIIKKYEENNISITVHRDLVATTQRQTECSTKEQRGRAPVDGSLEESQTIVESLLTQDIVTTTIKHVIGQKKNAGKSFAEFLMIIIKIFRKAIKDNKLRFEKSVGQSMIHQLNESETTLKPAYHTICSTEEGTKIFKNSVICVIIHATKVLGVIKTIPKAKWLSLSQSAETIGMLMSIFQKITKMLSSIPDITNEPLHHLFENIENLNASLTKIKKTLFLSTKIVGFSGTALYIVGGVTCIILGTVLCITPVAPVGIPFVVAGSFIVVTSPVVSDYFQSFYSDMTNAIDSKVEEGQNDGKEFLKDDIELSTP